MHKLGRVAIAGGLVVILLSGCGATPLEDPASPTPTTAPTTNPEPPPAATPALTPTPESTEATTAPSGTSAKPQNTPPLTGATAIPSPANSSSASKDVPVPKVMRPGGEEPRITAKPAEIDATVSYRDGVELSIADVRFGKESKDKEGPGFFPGREYAIFALEIINGSTDSFSLDTVVVTVLDASAEPVQPLDVEGADVVDFAGVLKPQGTKKARYAYALPSDSLAGVTVVVDFDNVHSSAVFRGDLG